MKTFFASSELGLSVIRLPEIISALNRLRSEKRIDGTQYLSLKHGIVQDLQDAVLCNITETTVLRCVLLLEENTLRAIAQELKIFVLRTSVS